MVGIFKTIYKKKMYYDDYILFNFLLFMSDELIQQILAAKNYYEILNVSSDCSSNEIKKNYRKLAIQVHPDRCQHKRATEAFQRISHAYQILSDQHKRFNYDQHLENENDFSSDDIDLTPEEIFKQFFKTEMNHNSSNTKINSKDQKHQLMALIFLIILTIISGIIFQKVTSESILTNITFDNLNNKEFVILKSHKFHIKFGLPKVFLSKLEDSKKLNKNFYQNAKKMADDLYLTKLKNKCSLEKKYNVAFKPKCDELENLMEMK
ncbi:hypothetical protein TRFO_05468 [Tritrichomonas foetus]|uniref:J domain-containing protein n=1 Tax=Tritrichomonas foetus TaxID=1144522 RepID=A0A1J4K719_9EUKA|nr:hypothetical protein TRFO_05468 [Tritrichomonas foetus]|eukprot:OHT06778.1 hypothetical protein TRFO_05468 [Tritrichomonas foetus]